MPKTINCILPSLASSCTVLTFPGNKSQLFWHYMFSCPSSKPPFCSPQLVRQKRGCLIPLCAAAAMITSGHRPNASIYLLLLPLARNWSNRPFFSPPSLFFPSLVCLAKERGKHTGQRRRRQILHKKRGGTPAASPGITLSPGRSGARYCCWRRKYPLEERNEALKLKIFLCFAFFITN